jgi:hypothetical protein
MTTTQAHPPFAVGERVQVRQFRTLGHVRTPTYVRGHVGTVERLCGAFPNPEELALGRPGLPEKRLYRVSFLQSQLWNDYQGPATDTVQVEIYEHWLESVEP